jgi:hypothetical protein
MPAPPPRPAPDAADTALAKRRIAVADRLAEIGMALAEALRRQASVPGAPRAFAGDLALAYSRIARAVRLSIILAQRLEDGLPAPDDAAARAAADAAAAGTPQAEPPEAEPDERLDEREDESMASETAERGDREADERAWLTRPISALAAQICRDLDQPYDAVLWGEDIPGPYPRAGRRREGGGAGVSSADPMAAADSPAGAERGASGRFGANTPIPPLPPSRGKGALLSSAAQYRPP